MDLLIFVMLLIIGITGLIKKRIKISSKKEIVGSSVIGLSIFYIIMGALMLFIKGALFLLVEVIALALATIIVVIFAKKQAIVPKSTEPQA